MKTIILEGVIPSKERSLEICSRHIVPLLEKILKPFEEDFGKTAPKEVTISKNQLCINGCEIGDYRYICRFSIYGNNGLSYDFRGKQRVIFLGGMFPDPDNFYKVTDIWEFNNGTWDYI